MTTCAISGSSPFYQLICSALASLTSSPCNLGGLQCTCLYALSVLSCFCTDHSGLLSCKLFCIGCCRLACSARSLAEPSQLLDNLFIHLVFTGHHIPPKCSFSLLPFSRTSHPNSQLIIAISPTFLRELRSHVLPRSSPFYPEAPPWNFILSSLNLHLSPLRP